MKVISYRMLRFSLTDPVSKCYDKIDKNTIELKSGFIGLCTEIDRYFRLAFSMDLNKPIGNYHTEAFDKIFPNLSSLTRSQLEQLRRIYCEIRNINAHLFFSKPIYITSELADKLVNIAIPKFDISYNGELTIFGMLYVLAFICQKYQMWPFLSECFKSTYFFDITKKETSKIQTETEHYLQTFCGLGKPRSENQNTINMESQYINDTCKRYMTKVFFALEKSILRWSFSSHKSPSFSCLLKNNMPFSRDNELTSDLIRLRNYWFHGNAIFDTFSNENEESRISLEYVMSAFAKLKSLLKDSESYKVVITLIEEFGERLMHFYVLRIIEVSYKILDKRLLTKDKVESRIIGANQVFARFEKVSPKYFETALKLINEESFSYSVHAPRFLGFRPRTTSGRSLRILKITSKYNLSIGNFQSNQNEVCLALVDIDKKYLNTINGVLPHELNGIIETNYSSRIYVKRVVLE